MSTTVILIIVYILSALIVGSMHWAAYHDEKKKGYVVSMEQRVMKLYILPLCPVVNTWVTIGILLCY